MGRGLATGGFFGAIFIFFLLSSISFDSSCNFGLSNPPSLAPVKDGLGVATTPDGSTEVVVDSQSRLVSVISHQRLVSQIPLGVPGNSDATDVVITPSGKLALVTDSRIRSRFGVVVVIDLTTDRVDTTIPVGSGPSAIALSPDGSRAYVSDTGYINNGNVAIIDLATFQVVGYISVGQQPVGLAVSPDGSTLYVADATLYLQLNQPPNSDIPGYVDVVDLANDTIVKSVQVDVAPLILALSSDGTSVAVGNYGSNSISVFNTRTFQVVTLKIEPGVFGVAFSPHGSSIYVTAGDSPLLDSAPGSEPIIHSTSNVMTIVNTHDYQIAHSVNLESDPTGIVTDRSGRIYVAEGTFPGLIEISPSTLKTTQIGIPALGPPRVKG